MAKKKKKRDLNLAYRKGNIRRTPENPTTGPKPKVAKPKQTTDLGGPGDTTGGPDPTLGRPGKITTDTNGTSKKSSRKRKGSGYTTFLGETPGMGPLSPAGTPPRDRRGRGRRDIGLGFGPGQGGGGTPGAGGQGK